MKQSNDMSDRDETEELITNEDTRTRRAWVARALESVRRRLEGEPALPEATEPAERPQLYVVPSGRKR